MSPAPGRAQGHHARAASAAGADAPVADATGIQNPGRPANWAAKAALDAVLFVPRKTVELLFFATGAAAGLVRDEQVVPRLRELIFFRRGQVGVFPTIFAETGSAPSVGARMIARTELAATTFRVGYGGPDELVTESRVLLNRSTPLPSVLALEWLLDERANLEYLGVGQDPENDARNRFATGTSTREARYRERRMRAIGSVGIRPSDEMEIFLSSSLTRRRVDDARDVGDAALSRVFAPGSVPGAFDETRILYGELALRIDSRADRGRPSPGGLLETYVGTARGLGSDPTNLIRVGGRAAFFVPILHEDNILSPRISVDGVASPTELPIPFTELARQPQYRGFDNRRDQLSFVASVDYRWIILRYLAARLFVDGATVGPDFAHLPLTKMRYAGGIGLDLFTSSTELGRLNLAVSGEGFRVSLSFGIATGFGDRQHRD